MSYEYAYKVANKTNAARTVTIHLGKSGVVRGCPIDEIEESETLVSGLSIAKGREAEDTAKLDDEPKRFVRVEATAGSTTTVCCAETTDDKKEIYLVDVIVSGAGAVRLLCRNRAGGIVVKSKTCPPPAKQEADPVRSRWQG